MGEVSCLVAFFVRPSISSLSKVLFGAGYSNKSASRTK